MVQALGGAPPRLRVPLRDQQAEQGTKERKSPGVEPGANRGSDTVAAGGPIDLRPVQDGAFRDRYAVLQQVTDRLQHEGRRDTDKRRVYASQFS